MKRVEGEEVITKLRIRAKRERERGKIECVTSCCCCTAGGFYTPVCCLLFFFFLFTKIKITSLVFFSLSLLLHLLFIVWWLFDHAVVLIFLVPSLARHPVSAPQPCENRGIFVARARYDDNIDRKAELFIGVFSPPASAGIPAENDFSLSIRLGIVIPDLEFRALPSPVRRDPNDHQYARD